MRPPTVSVLTCSSDTQASERVHATNTEEWEDSSTSSRACSSSGYDRRLHPSSLAASLSGRSTTVDSSRHRGSATCLACGSDSRCQHDSHGERADPQCSAGGSAQSWVEDSSLPRSPTL